MIKKLITFSVVSATSIAFSGCQSTGGAANASLNSGFSCQAGQYTVVQQNLPGNSSSTSSTSSTASSTTSGTSTTEPSSGYINIRPVNDVAEYYIQMTAGTPAQQLQLVLDTGSSNMVVPGGASICSNCQSTFTYTPGPTATNLNKEFPISYGSGTGLASGYTDNVIVPCSNATLNQLPFAVMTSSQSLPGILGLAYNSIALPPSSPMPLFFDAFVKNSNGMFSNVFAMSLCGPNTPGSVILGSPDARVDRSTIQWTAIIDDSYYVVDARNLSVGGWALNSSGTFVPQSGAQTVIGAFTPYNPTLGSGIKTIIDSGSTFTFLPPTLLASVQQLMQAVNSKVNGGIPNGFFSRTSSSDPNYAISIPDSVINKFPTLYVSFTGTNFNLISVAMSPQTYFKSWNNGTRVFGFSTTSGLQILGQVFMENTYVEFDRNNQLIGFGSNSATCSGN